MAINRGGSQERRWGIRNAGGCLWAVIMGIAVWAVIIVLVVGSCRVAG